MSRYNPWRHLHSMPHLHVSCRHELAQGTAGLTRGRRIWLHRGLGQCGRRCTLGHELVHVELGVTPGVSTHPWFGPREERTVEKIAARRLITIDELIAALRWTQHPDELAEELWVDPPILQARLGSLTPDERKRIRAALDDNHWNN